MSDLFNYIVPIFNKEDVLPLTLQGIERCASSSSKIFLVVDGCTDRSESIVDEYIKNSSHKVEKLIMPNVHMLLSVNAGLSKVKSGFSIIMQDDIVLEDPDTEKNISNLYGRLGNNLGVISFRYGSNVKPTPLINRLKMKTIKNMIQECDFIKGPSDEANFECGEYKKFYPRMSSINGPNCIPWNLLSKIGLFDARLAPYGYDDPEYCLRALQSGFINGLFPVLYRSDLEWGGTRRSKDFQRRVLKIHKKNRIYIWEKHKTFLQAYLRDNKIYNSLEDI